MEYKNNNILEKIETIYEICYKLTNKNIDIELCKIIVKLSYDILENHPISKLIKKYIYIFFNENNNNSIPISWRIQKDIEKLEYQNDLHYILLLYYSNCKYFIPNNKNDENYGNNISSNNNENNYYYGNNQNLENAINNEENEDIEDIEIYDTILKNKNNKYYCRNNSNNFNNNKIKNKVSGKLYIGCWYIISEDDI